MTIEIAAAYAVEPKDADGCFALGMNYSAGAGVAVDLIEAHKWFNIAAMRGHADAAQLRREIAEQMADAEIGRAQRAARDWLKAQPPATVAAPASTRGCVHRLRSNANRARRAASPRPPAQARRPDAPPRYRLKS